MTKQAAAVGAFVAVYVLSTWIGGRAGKGDSTIAEHVVLQTREDIGGIFACLVGLLAGILATLLF